MTLPSWMTKLLGVVFIIFLVLLSLNQLKLLRGEPQTMNVSATGEAESVPDLAMVTVGVMSEGETAEAVKADNNQKMNRVVEFIKQQGIAEKDIQTSAFYINPKYNYSNNQNTIVGYQANQTITIKLRNINKSTAQLEKIVDGVVANGANQLQGVNFSFENDDALSQLARKNAINRAIKKANEIAVDAGLRLGPIINVITTGNDGVMPVAYRASMVNAKSAATNIEPGMNKVSESVTLVFELKRR